MSLSQRLLASEVSDTKDYRATSDYSTPGTMPQPMAFIPIPFEEPSAFAAGGKMRLDSESSSHYKFSSMDSSVVTTPYSEHSPEDDICPHSACTKCKAERMALTTLAREREGDECRYSPSSRLGGVTHNAGAQLPHDTAFATMSESMSDDIAAVQLQKLQESQLRMVRPLVTTSCFICFVLAVCGWLYLLCIETYEIVADLRKFEYGVIRSVLIPLALYLLNSGACQLLHSEAHQMHFDGYTSFFLQANALAKKNFRQTSLLSVLILAAYVLITTSSKGKILHHKDLAALVMWSMPLLLMTSYQLSSFLVCYRHNKLRPARERAPFVHYKDLEGNGFLMDDSLPTHSQLHNGSAGIDQRLLSREKERLQRSGGMSSVGAAYASAVDAESTVKTAVVMAMAMATATTTSSAKHSSASESETERKRLRKHVKALEADNRALLIEKDRVWRKLRKTSLSLMATHHSAAGSAFIGGSVFGGHSTTPSKSMAATESSTMAPSPFQMLEERDKVIERLERRVTKGRQKNTELHSRLKMKVAISETREREMDQLQHLLETKDRKIEYLRQQYDALEMDFNDLQDSEQRLINLLAVKDEDISIQSEENKRLRQKLRDYYGVK